MSKVHVQLHSADTARGPRSASSDTRGFSSFRSKMERALSPGRDKSPGPNLFREC